MTTCFSSWMLEFSAGSIYISLAECVSNQIATELNLKMATKCFGRILLLVSVFFNETICSIFINSYSKKVRMYTSFWSCLQLSQASLQIWPLEVITHIYIESKTLLLFLDLTLNNGLYEILIWMSSCRVVTQSNMKMSDFLSATAQYRKDMHRITSLCGT